MKQTIRILSALLAACLMLTAFGCLVKDDADTTALPPTASPDVESNDAPAVPAGDRNAVAIKLDEIDPGTLKPFTGTHPAAIRAWLPPATTRSCVPLITPCDVETTARP